MNESLDLLRPNTIKLIKTCQQIIVPRIFKVGFDLKTKMRDTERKYRGGQYIGKELRLSDLVIRQKANAHKYCWQFYLL